MHPFTTKNRALRAGLLAIALTGLAAGAQAQGNPQYYLGGAVGSTDFGTGIRLFGGGSITPVFGWEAQVVTFGSEHVNQGERSAWALGASGVAKFPLATAWTAFGKLGLHTFQLDTPGHTDSSLELGIGVGALWHFSPSAAMRIEYENIGGSDGNMISVGVQFPL